MKCIINYLLCERYGIENIHIFFDGCTSQFKNKFTMSSLLWYNNEYKLNPKSYFFPTSHVKTAVDGIGATVKRAAWSLISRK